MSTTKSHDAIALADEWNNPKTPRKSTPRWPTSTPVGFQPSGIWGLDSPATQFQRFGFFERWQFAIVRTTIITVVSAVLRLALAERRGSA